MRPKSISYTIEASDADGICASQTPLAAGPLTIDGILTSGGVLTLSTAQHVSVSCAGADSGRTFTITGTDMFGLDQTEDIAGSAGSITKGTKNFKTVTSVSADDATAGAITVGVLGELETPWVPLNWVSNPFNVGYHVVIGTATFEFQGTLDDIQDTDVTPSAIAVVASGSSSVSGALITPMRALRVKITAFTSGTVKLNLIQAGG